MKSSPLLILLSMFKFLSICCDSFVLSTIPTFRWRHKQLSNSKEDINIVELEEYSYEEVTGAMFTNATIIAEKELLKKKLLAGGSVLTGIALFFFQTNLPASNVAILKAMERDSVPISVAMCNGKPTVIDFYADWCINCKVMAPTMRQMEFKYGKDVNFVTLDGTDPSNNKLVETFKVDGIPHLAFISSNSELKTTLVGSVPKSILIKDLDALTQNKELPYEGYDVFGDGPTSSNVIPLKKIGAICKNPQ